MELNNISVLQHWEFWAFGFAKKLIERCHCMRLPFIHTYVSYPISSSIPGNYRWHKRCFKCCWCNKFLNPSNCNVHQGFLFCRHCLDDVTK